MNKQQYDKAVALTSDLREQHQKMATTLLQLEKCFAAMYFFGCKPEGVVRTRIIAPHTHTYFGLRWRSTEIRLEADNVCRTAPLRDAPDHLWPSAYLEVRERELRQLEARKAREKQT